MKKLVYLLFAVLCMTLFSCTKDEVVTPDEPIQDAVTPNENNSSVYESPATDFKYEIVIDNLKPRVAITKYIGNSKNVVVPSEIDGVPVTSFRKVYNEDGIEGVGAFEGSDVETVVLGENIITVGTQTFKDCKELKSITFKKNTLTVGFKAFENCTALEIVDFSDTQLFQKL